MHKPLLTYLLTYSMVQSPSWEANLFAASQDILRISRNPKIHYRTHKRPPPVSILGQPNRVHIHTSHLLEIRPNIIHPSTPRSPQYSLSLRFPHQDPSTHFKWYLHFIRIRHVRTRSFLTFVCAALFSLVYICASGTHQLHLPDILLKKILCYVEKKLFTPAETSYCIFICTRSRTHSALSHSNLKLNIPLKPTLPEFFPNHGMP